MLPDSQQKSMLSITVCNEDGTGYEQNQDPQHRYELMLNPKDMGRNRKICYSRQLFMGAAGIEQKFNAILSEVLTFSFVIDGTGVVKTTTVADELKMLRNVIYDKGDQREPNHVRIVWGKLKFCGRLKDMDAKYTLFLPNGDPLRAEVSLSFVEFKPPEEEALKNSQNSPGLTQQVEVMAGDTLPLLCARIYNDPSLCPEVARINNMDNIRNLTPGTRLQFPPLS